MKVAIFQGYCDIHFECDAYLLEAYRNEDVTLFTQHHPVADEYDRFFSKFFTYTRKHICEYNVDNYDLTVLVSDDDPFFPNDIPMNKVIVVNHGRDLFRRNNIIWHIHNRPYRNNDVPWALPVWQHTPKEEKLTLINKPPVIACIGYGCHADISVYQSIIANNPDATINVMGRFVNFPSAPQVNWLQFVPLESMFEIVKNSTHILFTDQSDCRSKNCMSATMIIALATGCQIIMPSNWEYDCLVAPIRFDRFDDIRVPRLTEEIIDSIYQDRQNMVEHRDKTLMDMYAKMRGVGGDYSSTKKDDRNE